jgi:hypothetical protein
MQILIANVSLKSPGSVAPSSRRRAAPPVRCSACRGHLDRPACAVWSQLEDQLADAKALYDDAGPTRLGQRSRPPCPAQVPPGRPLRRAAPPYLADQEAGTQSARRPSISGTRTGSTSGVVRTPWNRPLSEGCVTMLRRPWVSRVRENRTHELKGDGGAGWRRHPAPDYQCPAARTPPRGPDRPRRRRHGGPFRRRLPQCPAGPPEPGVHWSEAGLCELVVGVRGVPDFTSYILASCIDGEIEWGELNKRQRPGAFAKITVVIAGRDPTSLKRENFQNRHSNLAKYRFWGALTLVASPSSLAPRKCFCPTSAKRAASKVTRGVRIGAGGGRVRRRKVLARLSMMASMEYCLPPAT